MAEYHGTTGPRGSWEETYRKTPALELPWNSGTVDGDLRALLERGFLSPVRPGSPQADSTSPGSSPQADSTSPGSSPQAGKAYDLGCGPGNDAVYLAQKGWEVTAVDIAPSAIDLAKTTAREAGLEGKIKFLVSDVLALEKPGDARLVHDRGCFHTLPSGLWEDYNRMAAGLLGEGGTLALKVFSSKMPAGMGPYRFKPEEIQGVFGGNFELKEVKEGFFNGPAKPNSLFCVLTKRN